MMEFDDDAVERIVRRAVELESERDPSAVDRESLIKAAAEVGLDRGSIELAIAEHEIGPTAEPERLDWMFGPRTAVARRRIDGPHGPVDEAVGEWLARAQFRPFRRSQRTSEWDRRTDVAATAQRMAAAVVGGDRLRDTGRIEVRAVPIGPTATLVQVSGDRTTHRRAAVASSATLAGFAAATLAAGVWTPVAAVLALPLASVAVAVGIVTKRGTERASADIDRLLDQVAANERPSRLGTARRQIPAWGVGRRDTTTGGATR